ncbi:MAG: hypothetical protein H0T46_26975 [Deltaproteobacteria bacterium]|nr:hypothetical protein [Deltaproteobacteria bacterium]
MSTGVAKALGAALLAALAACGSSQTARTSEPIEVASARRATFMLNAMQPGADYNPFALAKASLDQPLSNEEASVPPQCYTRADGDSNACASCHTRSSAPNFADDWEFQQNYSFTEYGKTNRWKNQFRERSDKVASFTDDAILSHVRKDNYAPLRAWLAANPDSPGYQPDLDFAKGFSADGFATDGSGWRALRYKPFLGGFWATNGSTDDVFVRLPAAFRTGVAGEVSDDIYRTNLAILEAAISADPKAKLASLTRTIEPIDERVGGLDLDGDGQLATATTVVGLPARYVGGASSIAVTRSLYPQGVEFLHTVRYLDPDRPGFAATRMKEVRYAKKSQLLTERQIAKAYENIENPEMEPFSGNALTGMKNGFSWELQGYIEDANGWLRKQTNEETEFCMGCHSNVGVTVDQTFAFARKVPALAGWRMQDPTGIPDVPQAGHTTGEYAAYMLRTRGADDLRSNDEAAAKFLKNGTLDEVAAQALSKDITKVVLPSAKRAIALNRAYLANVMEQSYVWGREASTSPAKNVHTKIVERSTGLGEADRVYRDVRLQLDWSTQK